jgi:hypothetical protein
MRQNGSMVLVSNYEHMTDTQRSIIWTGAPSMTAKL